MYADRPCAGMRAGRDSAKRLRTRAAFLLSAIGAFPARGSSEAPLQASRDASTVTVASEGRPILTYRYGDAPFKPYVKTLCTPGGAQLLRDSPSDHVHHRGLMFALAVNGKDFWAEGPESGRQISLGAAETTAAANAVRIDHRLAWTPSGESTASAIEDRSIIVHGFVHGATLLSWATLLRPAPGSDRIVLTGSHYQGLGMRWVESMDGRDAFLHAAGDPGPIVRGVERLTPSTWTSYTADVGERSVTVALFDHPRNPRSPSGMFTMFKPFSYLSATPNVWKRPLEVKAGEAVLFRYGVAAWDGVPGRTAIETLYRNWGDLSRE